MRLLNYSLLKANGYFRKLLCLDKLAVYDIGGMPRDDSWCIQDSNVISYEHASFDLKGVKLSKTIRLPELYMYRLYDAYIVGRNGLIYHNSGRLFTVGENIPSVRFDKLFPPVKALAQRVQGPVCSLVGPVYENRAHFLREKLPKAIVAEQLMGKEVKFLIFRGYHWQYEYLAYVGIDAKRIIEVDKGATFCEQLYVIPQYHTLFAPDIYLEIRERFLKKIPIIKNGPALLISRDDAPDRKILNEDSLLAIIKQKYPGAIKINLSRIALDEQLKLIRNAPFIFGCHGQAFHLSLFSSEARMVQFSPGPEDSSSPYIEWGDHFIYFALLANSTCAHLFCNKSSGLHDDFKFPEKVLQRLIATNL